MNYDIYYNDAKSMIQKAKENDRTSIEFALGQKRYVKYVKKLLIKERYKVSIIKLFTPLNHDRYGLMVRWNRRSY